MEVQTVREEVLKQQPSAVCDKKEEGQAAVKPKLTMKFLYELIRGLQDENSELVQRVDELERQFAGVCRFEEEAAAAEVPLLTEIQESQEDAREVEDTKEGQKLYKIQEESLMAVLAEVLEPHPEPDIPQPICIPRSERHQKPRKNSFWPFRFHHRTILR